MIQIDDVVISANGEKINPDVLEKQVFIPLAKRFSILGYDDGNGKKLTLIVEITKDSNKLLLKRTVEEVNRLLKQFEQMKTMMKQFKNGNFKMPF